MVGIIGMCSGPVNQAICQCFGTMLAFPIASFLFEDAVYCSTLKSSLDLPFRSENYVPTYLYTLALPPVVNSSTDF